MARILIEDADKSLYALDDVEIVSTTEAEIITISVSDYNSVVKGLVCPMFVILGGDYYEVSTITVGEKSVQIITAY